MKERMTMQYEIKEIKLQNKRKQRTRLVITFANPKYTLLSEYLMVDAPLLNWRILMDLQQVLSNKKEEVQLSGNRTSIMITKEETKLDDLLVGLVDEDDLLETVVMSTAKFHEILLQWYKAYSKFEAKLNP